MISEEAQPPPTAEAHANAGLETSAVPDVDLATVALFDLDRTMHAGSSLAVLARYAMTARLLSRKTIGKAIVEETRFRSGRSSRTRLDDVAAWALELSAGTKLDEVQPIMQKVADRIVASARPAMRQLLANHVLAGHYCVLLSASPQPLVEMVSDGLGAHCAIGTELELEDGALTGKIIEPFCYGAAKIQRLQAVLGPITATSTLYAYADSISDLPLLEIADHPIVVTPDKQLREIAESKPWSIIDF